VARAASGCHWNETSADDDQRKTEDDSHQQDMREQHQRAIDARARRSRTRLADELAASAATVALA